MIILLIWLQRTFLFELLCFAGEFTRAEKQLAVLSSGSPEKETGAIVYYAALHAERTRHELFEKEDFPADSPVSPPGELNGKPFTELRDADPDIGARLEVFAAGAYVWLPFEHVESLEMGPPQRLRDTLWAPALVQAAPSFQRHGPGRSARFRPFTRSPGNSEDEAGVAGQNHGMVGG